LQAQYQSIEEEVVPAVMRVLERCDFILGGAVSELEKGFAQYVGASQCIAVASGTDALYLAVRAVGIGVGDEVLIPANTFIATAIAVSETGAKPVLVDICPDTYNMDPEQLESRLTGNTKAIIPVHLYGQPAAMDPILAFAEKHGLAVIEDACQAHGAVYKGNKCGSIGIAGCFSFYPGKNLGAYGDAGAITSSDSAFIEQATLLRNYGQKVKGEHMTRGINSRLDTIQATVLNTKLKHIEKWTDGRRKNALLYEKYLGDVAEITLPGFDKEDDRSHVFHLYVIRAKRRDELNAFLREQGVFCGIHYPVPIHLTGAYEDLGHDNGDFPVTETAAREILSLPMYAELTEEQVRHVADSIKQFYVS